MKIFILSFLFFIPFANADMLLDSNQSEHVITCHPTYENKLIKKECYPGDYNMGGIKIVKCSKGPYKGCCYQKTSGSTKADFKLTGDCHQAIK